MPPLHYYIPFGIDQLTAQMKLKIKLVSGNGVDDNENGGALPERVVRNVMWQWDTNVSGTPFEGDTQYQQQQCPTGYVHEDQPENCPAGTIAGPSHHTLPCRMCLEEHDSAETTAGGGFGSGSGTRGSPCTDSNECVGTLICDNGSCQPA